MALSWLNLPCALKPAIGNGKRTLGALASLQAPRGRSKALLRAKHAGDEPRPIARRYADKRLAQARLRGSVRHERSTFGLRLLTPSLVLAIEEADIAGTLRLRNPGVELGDKGFRPLNSRAVLHQLNAKCGKSPRNVTAI